MLLALAGLARPTLQQAFPQSVIPRTRTLSHSLLGKLVPTWSPTAAASVSWQKWSLINIHELVPLSWALPWVQTGCQGDSRDAFYLSALGQTVHLVPTADVLCGEFVWHAQAAHINILWEGKTPHVHPQSLTQA